VSATMRSTLPQHNCIKPTLNLHADYLMGSMVTRYTIADHNKNSIYSTSNSLHCSDTVSWETGRASGL